MNAEPASMFIFYDLKQQPYKVKRLTKYHLIYMTYADSSLLFMNAIIFYIIGIFLIFFTLNLKLFTLNEKVDRSKSIIHIGIKLLLVIFCIVFVSVFTSIYEVPSYFQVVPTNSIDEILLTLILAGLIYFILKYSLKEQLENRNIKSNPLIRLIIIIISIVFAVIFSGMYNPFNFTLLNQIPDLKNILWIILFGGIFYVLLSKTLTLLMNNNRDFDTEVFKTKYALFILVILLFFSIFSFKTVTTIQKNNYFDTTTDVTFSHDQSKVAFFVHHHYDNNQYKTPNLLKYKSYLVIKDLNSNNISFYPDSIAIPTSMRFFNNSVVLFYYYNYDSRYTTINAFDLNTRQNISTTPTENSYFPTNNMVITKLKYESPLMYQVQVRNVITNDSYNRLVNMSNFKGNFEYYLYTINPDFSYLAIFNPNQPSYQHYTILIYSLNTSNNSMVLENTIPIQDAIDSLNYINFASSDDTSVLFYYYSISNQTQLFSYNYLTEKSQFYLRKVR